MCHSIFLWHEYGQKRSYGRLKIDACKLLLIPTPDNIFLWRHLCTSQKPSITLCIFSHYLSLFLPMRLISWVWVHILCYKVWLWLHWVLSLNRYNLQGHRTMTSSSSHCITTALSNWWHTMDWVLRWLAYVGGMLVRYIRVQVGVDKGDRHTDWEWTKYAILKGHWCRPHRRASWERDLRKISRHKFAHFMARYFTSHQKTQ